ncbi:MAG: arginine--tRNA ligase [Clostridia bacterium]|nr:arginine--tRNA ligase [Clostridia bacterium]
MSVNNPAEYMKKLIKEKVEQAYKNAVSTGALELVDTVDFEVEVPKDSANGDFSANFAMKNVKLLKKAPVMIANAIIDNFDKGDLISEITVAGPGFINFRLSDAYYSMVAKTIIDLGEDYGKTNHFDGKTVLVEFVSANPTGPMHMGNARGGIIGDCLSSVLSWAGADVKKEFYVNDAGNQVSLFGESLYARLYQLVNGEDSFEFPDDGYHGDDIKVLAKEYLDMKGSVSLDDKETLVADMVAFGLEKNIACMQSDLEKYKIIYDKWFRESTLHKSGYVKETIDLLEKAGALYEADGAKWFKATDYGCEKDEVMVKANGFYTYYAVDLAYHRNKFCERNFERCINVLGADHHGHTIRYKAGMRALGIEEDRLDVVLMQLVRLMRDGKPFKMSKRTGKSITLSDLLDEIPADAARFFFNMNRSESVMDFDLSLAVKQDSENPMYYVQYAHARICSILRNLECESVETDAVDKYIYAADAEKELIKHLARFPEEIISAAVSMEPSKITKYVIDVASAFHSFYNACRIKGEDEATVRGRLALVLCAKTVIKNALCLMNIEAPEKM